tara:strand:- start:11960 stop:14476 length:2517 start_codon:yes stop_codon:yes gene_type:complete
MIREVPSLKNIKQTLQKRAKEADKFLLNSWEDSGLKDQNELGLFAVGGYGRRQLHPHSDIDLLLLSEQKIKPDLIPKVENFIQKIWDLNYQVGHSVRTFKEEEKQIKEDVQAMTNILEVRRLVATDELEIKLNNLIHSKKIWPKDSFLLEKIEEQKDRHHRFDNTEYNLEPNLKHSPGGLRDVHTIDWIKLNYLRNGFDLPLRQEMLSSEEIKELTKAKEWLWLLRYHLHLCAGKEEDRLLFNFQIPIGESMFPNLSRENASTEKLMHRYFRSAQSVSEINLGFLEAISSRLKKKKNSKRKEINDEFELIDHRITLKKGKSFKRNPSLMVKLFIEMSLNENIKGIESRTLRKLKDYRSLINYNFRKKRKNDDLFLELLSSNSPKMVDELKRMHMLGILPRLIPEFGRVTAQMQYDLFHIYTVDTHTLKLLKNMNSLLHNKNDGMFELASEIAKKLPKTINLYLAGFFHDIGKGRGGNHSSLGERIVKRFCKRNNFSKEDSDLIQWLVRNHLLMSKTSQKEDLSDSLVIKKFSKQVETMDRLNYLYCLTVSDISATNPNLWNSWNSSLLRELWLKARREIINDGHEEDKKQLLLENLNQLDKKKIKLLWSNFYDTYFQTLNVNQIENQTRLLLNNEKDRTIAKFIDPGEDDLLNLFIYTFDRPNVFSSVVSVLDSENINIFDAKLFGTINGFCIENITIADDSRENLLSEPEKLIEIEKRLKQTLRVKNLKPSFVSKRIPIRLKSFSKKTTVKINQDDLNNWTQLDIKTLDRPGLLASICKVFTDNKLSIKKASISTYGETAEDRFCVVTDKDSKLESEEKLTKLTASILKTLSGEDLE